MPLMKLKTSEPIPDKKRTELLSAMSKIIVESIGKPEKFESRTVIKPGPHGPSLLIPSSPVEA